MIGCGHQSPNCREEGGGTEGSDPDLKCFQDWNLVVPRRPMTQFNLFQKERETKPTLRGQEMKLNIDGHSAVPSRLGLQRKQCLVLKIQSVNQQKVLDGSKQLKSLGVATLFLKLTKAFRLQTNVTSPFWSEMLVQVQDLPPNRAKLSLYSYLSSYIWKQMAQPCLESKKTLALEPQRSLFLWLRPKIAHFNQGTKQGTFIACKALT